MLSVVAVGAGACAALLGIDDRDLVGTTSTVPEGGDSSPFTDGSSDAPIDVLDGSFVDAPKVTRCDPGACATAGGSCNMGVCTVACGTGCTDKTVDCPPGNDCTIVCDGLAGCDGLKCKGGHSCTLLCTGSGSCKNGASCESERCDFECTSDSCKTGPITCDASVCIAKCSGDKSCDKGVDFNASGFCGITCSGSPSCNAGGAPVRCIAPDASINCTNVANTCQDTKPTCYGPPGSTCAITCGAASSCGGGYCCDAGTCNFQGDKQINKCP